MRKKLMKVGFFGLGSAVLVSAMMLTSWRSGSTTVSMRPSQVR